MDWAKWERAAGEAGLLGWIWVVGFSVVGELVSVAWWRWRPFGAAKVFDRVLEREKKKKKLGAGGRRGSLCYCSDTI
jgi:hypothetical protein